VTLGPPPIQTGPDWAGPLECGKRGLNIVWTTRCRVFVRVMVGQWSHVAVWTLMRMTSLTRQPLHPSNNYSAHYHACNMAYTDNQVSWF